MKKCCHGEGSSIPGNCEDVTMMLSVRNRFCGQVCCGYMLQQLMLPARTTRKNVSAASFTGFSTSASVRQAVRR